MASALDFGRPTYHLTPPQGWLNDPCAPFFDGENYFLFFQWNPKSVEWGDICWGLAVSSDLLHWRFPSQSEPVLRPDQSYDCKGVFTGCAWPTKEKLSLFYTSVKHLPIHWSEPYKRGCEGVAHAYSEDQGRTWKKSKANPIVQEEPPNIHVTGFRDPFVARCKEFDELLGGEKLYGLLSGGIHEEGPRLFLYSVDPVNVENWEYLATLLNGVPISFGSGSHFAGDFGRNLECGSFVHLKSDDGKYTRLTFLAGAEGGNEARHVADYAKNQPLAPHRAARWTNWFFAHPKRVNHAIDLDVKQVGRYDNGIFYAAAPQTLADGRIILHGWIIEEDLPLDDLRSKGWTGDLGVPREIFLQTFEGIESGLETPLAKIESLETVPSPSNSTERTRHLTFGIRPFREVDNLRGRPLDISLPSEILSGHTYNLLQDCAPSAELRLCFRLVGSCNTVRVWLRHNKRLDVGTILEVDLIKETIRVDRSASNSRDDIHKSDEIGAFTLFKHQNEASISACEDLQLRIFMDHNILEVFANDRFAMSTRIYAPQDCRSVSVGFEGTSKFGVDLVEAIAWPMKSIGLADLAKTVQFTHL